MEEAPGGHAAAGTDEVTRFTAETIAVRQRRGGAWVLIALGVGCILFGGMFAAAKYSGHDVVAMVTHEGPCSNGTCTVDVAYNAAGGPVTAVMYGVISSEIYGPPSRRLLNITYQPGSETDPTTNDMPDAVWIGFGAAGLAFAGWGTWLRLRRKRPRQELAVAAAGGAPANAALHTVVAPALGGQPGPGGPAGISGRGTWVSDQSGAITIATIEPRFMAGFLTLTACALAGSWVQDGPQWVRHAPRWAAVTYLVIVGAALAWGCIRGWRIGLRIDQDGVTVRNFFRTHRFSLAEVRRFADGSAAGGESKRWWALRVVLRDGRTVTARGTTRSGPPAPKTLAAIRQAAERHAITAELTGTAARRGSREAQTNPGIYPDPGGQPGLRRWDGRQWSPFLLRADPADGKPGRKAPAEVWSPLAGSEPQWQDAAGRVRRAGIVFAAWLGVTAVAVAVTAGLYARDLSKPQADFTLAVVALSAAAFALIMTCIAWSRRKGLKKIDRASKAAAAPAGIGDNVAGWAAGATLPSELAGGFPLPADVRGAEPSAWRRRAVPLIAAAVSVAGTVAVTAIVLGSSAAPRPAATARTPRPAHAPAVRELTIGQLRPGDCLQGPSDVNTARSWPAKVTVVPCSEKHLAEVVFSANYWPRHMAFPGHATMARQARTECRKRFQVYDGAPVAASEDSFRYISPWNRADWHSGSRLLLCTAYVWDSQWPAGVPLWRSIKGSDT